MQQKYEVIRLADQETEWLDRTVQIKIFLPPTYRSSSRKFPLLMLNDGQDNERVKLKSTLEKLTANRAMEPMIVVTVEAGDRMQEYGVAAKQDYLKRGRKAKKYAQYITKKLMPSLLADYRIDARPERHAIAGYSLGGLSALDIAWNHPELFQWVGSFSGSFWWRQRDAQSKHYSDYHDRIMHRQIRRSKYKPGLRFWFQTGTLDEISDRNNNGVIDSIDDTLDIITELVKKGYRPYQEITYYEIENGRHDTDTWAQAMPVFLQWLFQGRS